MNEEEKIKKIKQTELEFLEEVRRIERIRDEKIKDVKKGIDQRKIDQILLDLKNNL